MCWYCHWGLPKPVADIYKAALDELQWEEPLEYGPSHIVWSDFNLEDENIDFCIKACDEYYYQRPMPNIVYDTGQIEIVRESLVKLKAIPESIRVPQAVVDCEDAGMNANPADYPPPAGMEMVKI